MVTKELILRMAEKLDTVIFRFMKQGLSAEETAARMNIPVAVFARSDWWSCGKFCFIIFEPVLRSGFSVPRRIFSHVWRC